jgi:rod shape-determining protein MreD
MANSVRSVLPILFAFFAIIATLVPVGTAPGSIVGPNFVLISFAFWLIRRPSLVTPIAVFVIGAVLDCARAGPFGLELFVLLLVTQILRTYSERWPVYSLHDELLRFSLTAAAFEILCWSLLTVTFAQTPDLRVMIGRWAITVALYPPLMLVQKFVSGVHRTETPIGASTQ